MPTHVGRDRRFYRLEILIDKIKQQSADGGMPRCICQPRAVSQAEWIILHLTKDPLTYFDTSVIVWKALQASLKSEPNLCSHPIIQRARALLAARVNDLRKEAEANS
jgi:hypothetical protein